MMLIFRLGTIASTGAMVLATVLALLVDSVRGSRWLRDGWHRRRHSSGSGGRLRFLSRRLLRSCRRRRCGLLAFLAGDRWCGGDRIPHLRDARCRPVLAFGGDHRGGLVPGQRVLLHQNPLGADRFARWVLLREEVESASQFPVLVLELVDVPAMSSLGHDALREIDGGDDGRVLGYRRGRRRRGKGSLLRAVRFVFGLGAPDLGAAATESHCHVKVVDAEAEGLAAGAELASRSSAPVDGAVP